MKYVLIVLAFVASLAHAEVPLPARDWVVDQTGTLSAQQIDALKKRAELLDKQTGAIVLAVIVPTIGDESIEAFSMRLAEAWHPGHAGDERAAILIISKGDKRIRIETSRAISSKLTDAATGNIRTAMTEGALSAKAGRDYNKGLNIFYDEVAKYIPPKGEVSMTALEDTTDNTLWIVWGTIASLLSIALTSLFLVKQNEKREREKLAAAQRELERVRRNAQAAERERQMQHQVFGNHATANMAAEVTRVHRSEAALAVGLVAAAAGATAMSKRPTVRPSATPSRTSSSSRNSGTSRPSDTTSSWSSSDSDDSSSRSSWSSSPSSTPDSGSSSSSFDGGGSSGSFD